MNILFMHCNCRSKQLYKQYQKLTFVVDQHQLPQMRTIAKEPVNPSHHQILSLMYSSSEIYLPTHIQKISMDEVYASPLWFYKNFVACNKPCVITDAVQMGKMEDWDHPKQFGELTKELGKVSVSITPDGFADSIKNQYFVEPAEIKASVKDLIDWRQQQKQKNGIESDWVPYIQHQNSNLTKQLNSLTSFIGSDMKDFMSSQFFQGNLPDASNFWMGYSNSVSAIHKDPYENFYTTIVGEKHFTLLPPISIAFLQEQAYKTARWRIHSETHKLEASTQSASNYQTTNWISCNPDLQHDWKLFPELQRLKDNIHHVVLQSGQTLYLPSLWYHQVAQTHQQSPYTVAVNHWFDMSFNHNYSLYEAARKLKGYI